jgi:D-beta-D-heptose 7-phosphate kinase/D-beta-D-heptose 1-phosphate adenosyltransferase
VIVATEELGAHAGVVAMVDGGFDPIHPGHVAYFREAAALGAPVLCNVSSDDWVGAKHRPLLTQAERAEIIDAIRFVDYVHLSHGTTEDVLRALRPRFYVKGADWRDRLPAEQVEICAGAGTEIVYLDTVLGSSTAILERWQPG